MQIKEQLINLIFFVGKLSCSALAVYILMIYAFDIYKNWEYEKNTPVPPFVDDGMCNVATVPVGGTIGIGISQATVDESGNTIYTVPATGDIDRIIHDLEYIKDFSGINAVILQIDSYGGFGNADEVLLAYLKNYPKPVVSLVREAGASMGYAVALGGNKIFAYPGSTIGSIGVDSSFVSTTEKNEKEGLRYVSIVSGKYKDLGNPDREFTKEELEFLKKENQKYYERFVNLVSEKRGIPKEKVKELADGRTWLSDEAKELGLIDEVGTKEDVLNWIATDWTEKGIKQEPLPCAMY